MADSFASGTRKTGVCRTRVFEWDRRGEIEIDTRKRAPRRNRGSTTATTRTATNLGHDDRQPRLGGNHYHLQGFVATAVFAIIRTAAAVPSWRRHNVTMSAEPSAASRPSSQPRHRPRPSDMTTNAAAAAASGEWRRRRRRWWPKDDGRPENPSADRDRGRRRSIAARLLSLFWCRAGISHLGDGRSARETRSSTRTSHAYRNGTATHESAHAAEYGHRVT